MTAAERAEVSRQCAIEAVEESRQKFLRAAKKEGLTITKLARTVKEALEATEKKAFCCQGFIVYAEEIPDYKTRLDAVKIAGDYFGLKAVERKEENINHTGTIVFKRAGVTE